MKTAQNLLPAMTSFWHTLRGTQQTGNTPMSFRVPLKPSPPMPSAAVYQAANYGLSRLTTQDRQKLMAWLYQTNIVTKTIMRQTVNPIVGSTGFSYQLPQKTTTCEQMIDRYLQFNRLNRKSEQRNIVKQYLNSGEVALLAAPFQDTYYTVRCPSLLVRQTLLDPCNFQEVIGIMLEPDYFKGKTYIYKTITDDTRLSPQALAIRAKMEHLCFYWANFEHDEVEDAPGWTTTPDFDVFLENFGIDAHEWVRKQRRGEPFFSTWIDMMNHLVDTLWAQLDRVKSWGAFNYKFQVNTQDPDLVSSMKKVKQWQDAIGTPEMNSAIYVDQNVDVQPMNFPMQSADIKTLLDTMLQVVGMSANAASYDLGANLNTTYATSKSQGSPQEQFQLAVQGDIEDMFRDQFQFILKDAAAKGRIPAQEQEQFYGGSNAFNGIQVTSNELAKKDRMAQANIYATSVASLEKVLAFGLHDLDSVAAGITKLAEENLGIELIAYTKEDRERLQAEAEAKALEQAQQQQAALKAEEQSPEAATTDEEPERRDTP